jgi:hypothetical protein
MRDLVSYILPFGGAGTLAARFVARRLRDIFDFRRDSLEQMTWKQMKREN